MDRMEDDTASAPVPGARRQAATPVNVGTSYQEDRPYLIRFLLRHGAEYPEAEDAVHSAFVELMRSSQPVRSPRAWLRTVALRAFSRQLGPRSSPKAISLTGWRRRARTGAPPCRRQN